MTAYLRRLGYTIGPKRVRRLMREMALMPIYPTPKTSQRHKEHKVYPYLLNGLNIIKPNQVWCADITYVRLAHGFVYLVAIMDWFSRYVLSWQLSQSLDTFFCCDCLKDALKYGCPEIFNTDQGSQFTCVDFTSLLNNHSIAISMDGRGRVFDNIFIERLWRTVKYENVYIHDYRFIPEARNGLKHYFEYYNTRRLHASLKFRTPWEAYTGLEDSQFSINEQMVLTP